MTIKNNVLHILTRKKVEREILGNMTMLFYVKQNVCLTSKPQTLGN